MKASFSLLVARPFFSRVNDRQNGGDANKRTAGNVFGSFIRKQMEAGDISGRIYLSQAIVGIRFGSKLRVERAWPEVCFSSISLEETPINNASSFSNFPRACSALPHLASAIYLFLIPFLQSHAAEVSETELLDGQNAHRAHRSRHCNEELH